MAATTKNKNSTTERARRLELEESPKRARHGRQEPDKATTERALRLELDPAPVRLTTEARRKLFRAPEQLTGRVTRALGRAWAAIRRHHRDLPDAVVILGAVHEKHLGHWSFARWRVEGELAGEVLIAGELIAPETTYPAEGLTAAQRVFAVLLHEAAHALADARRVVDVSRGGRYHNEKYKQLAEEVGLECEQTDHGWSVTKLAADTLALYQREIGALDPILIGYRQAEDEVEEQLQELEKETHDEEGREARYARRAGGSGGGRRVTAVCSCESPRRIQVVPSVFDLGPIRCGLCRSDFAADD